MKLKVIKKEKKYNSLTEAPNKSLIDPKLDQLRRKRKLEIIRIIEAAKKALEKAKLNPDANIDTITKLESRVEYLENLVDRLDNDTFNPYKKDNNQNKNSEQPNDLDSDDIEKESDLDAEDEETEEDDFNDEDGIDTDDNQDDSDKLDNTDDESDDTSDDESEESDEKSDSSGKDGNSGSGYEENEEEPDLSPQSGSDSSNNSGDLDNKDTSSEADEESDEQEDQEEQENQKNQKNQEEQEEQKDDEDSAPTGSDSDGSESESSSNDSDGETDDRNSEEEMPAEENSKDFNDLSDSDNSDAEDEEDGPDVSNENQEDSEDQNQEDGESKSDNNDSGTDEDDEDNESDNSNSSENDEEESDDPFNSEPKIEDDKILKDPFANDQIGRQLPPELQNKVNKKELEIESDLEAVTRILKGLKGKAREGARAGLIDGLKKRGYTWLVKDLLDESLILKEARDKHLDELSEQEYSDLIDSTLDLIDKLDPVSYSNDLEARVKEIKADAEDAAKRRELDQEDNSYLNSERRQDVSSRREKEKYNKFKGLDQFKLNFYRAIKDQVEQREEDEDTWSVINRRHEDDPSIIQPGNRLEDKYTDDIPTINVYFDQSGSWSDNEVKIGSQAIKVVKEFENKKEIALNIWYFANHVHKDQISARKEITTKAWDDILDHISANRCQNVVILTDADMNLSAYASGRKVIVPGCVWYLWKNGVNAEQLPKHLMGKISTGQYEFNSK